jgi:uncharacterized protein YjbI with pentapeptide repeats
MKILKQCSLSLSTHPVMLDQKQWLATGVMLYFDLLVPDNLLKEQDMWQEVMAQLGANPLIDQGWPKPKAEFLVAGTCCAPGKETLQATKVLVSVGKAKKELAVFGDRYWAPDRLGGKTMSSPQPFSEMPITWDRAFGGEGYGLNPEGKGFVEHQDGNGTPRRPLPNIEHPDRLMLSPSDKPVPAGFGIIPPHYPQRAKLSGTYDKRWKKERWPGFPEDFNPDFFLAAQEDQRFQGFFTGKETIEIRNMNHEVSCITSRLPQQRIRLFFMRRPEGRTDGYLKDEIAGGEYFEAKLSAETLWLFPNIMRGVLLYRALVPCRDDEYSDIAWAHVVEEDPATEPLPIEHYRDILLEQADFGQGVIAEKMRELERELVKGAISVRNLPKTIRQMQAGIDGSSPANDQSPGTFHNTWAPFVEKCQKKLQERPEVLQCLTELGIADDCISWDRLGWYESSPETSTDPELQLRIPIPAGLVIPQVVGSGLVGLTIRPEPFTDTSIAFRMPGSEETPIVIDAATADGPVVVVPDELSALLVETEAGDFSDIIVMPTPDFRLPETARKRIADGASVILLLPGPASNQKTWEKKLPEAKPAALGNVANLFEAKQIGVNLREAILSLLPVEMASRHRLVVPGITPSSLPGTPVEEAMSAEAFRSAFDKGYSSAQEPPPAMAVEGRSSPEKPGVSSIQAASSEAVPASLAEGTDMEALQELTRENLQQRLDSGTSFSMASFSKLDLQGIDFSGRDLSTASFEHCSMQGCRFGKARLEGTMFTKCDLGGADLSGAILERTMFDRCKLAGMRCVESNLFMTSISDGVISGADFSGSTLKMVNLRGCVLANANLNRTNLELCTVSESNLSKSRFDGARFQKSTLEKCKLDQVTFSGITTDALLIHHCSGENVQLEQSDLFKFRIGERCDFPGLKVTNCRITQGYFRKANLNGASFAGSTIKGSIFDSCDLTKSDFAQVSLTGCEFPKSDLSGADLSGSNLFMGSLRKAKLPGADLTGANLYGADFRKCVMGNTRMRDVNLKRSLLEGLEDELRAGGHIV